VTETEQELTAIFQGSNALVKKIQLAASRQIRTDLEEGTLLANFASRLSDLTQEYRNELSKRGLEWDEDEESP